MSKRAFNALAICFASTFLAVPAMAQIVADRPSSGDVLQNGLDYQSVVKTKMESIARDPTSLIYQWGDPPRLGWTKLLFGPRHQGLVGCVRVKGKNAYGGYADWNNYIYVIDPTTKQVIANINFPTPNKFMPRLLRRGDIGHDPHCPDG